MKVIFTLCSLNYLGQAKTLMNSAKATNPDWTFILGIVDKDLSRVDLTGVDCEVLLVEKVHVDNFEWMVANYTIVEFVTAVKPFYFKQIFKNYPDCDKIIYLDPDIVVYDSFSELEKSLETSDIILTPHFLAPIDDGLLPSEKHVFNTGVFNLGYLSVKRSDNTMAMLDWWGRRLEFLCILDLTRGLFVDQLWMTLAPAIFDRVMIDRRPGYNMAHWNLHERSLEKRDGRYFANGQSLVFYHFSHYNPNKPEQIASFHTRFSFDTRPDLVELYADYNKQLLGNRYNEFKKVPCLYMVNEKRKKRARAQKQFIRNILPLSTKLWLRKYIK